MKLLTPTEKLTRAIIQLQGEKPFWAYLTLNMKRIEMNDTEKNYMKARGTEATIGVNAKGDLFYNPEWIDKLTEEELKGVMCHEVFHVAFTHLARLNSRNPLVWNLATDAVVNDALIADGISLPKNGIISKNHTVKIAGIKIEKLNEKQAEIVYNELCDELDKQKQNGGNSDEQDGDNNIFGDSEVPSGFDYHDYSYKEEKEGKEGKDGEETNRLTNGRPMTKAQADKIKDKWEKKLTEAVIFAKARGTLPVGMERRLEELLNNKISWKEKLYKYMTNYIPSDFTWSRCSRRGRAIGVYFPDTTKENLDITVAVDVSGSIGENEYQEFMSEVGGIARAFEHVKIECLFWDTAVNDNLEFKNGNIKKILDVKISGGGGTTFQCVTDYLRDERKNPKVVIVFTDGYIEEDYKLPNAKVLWVICKKGSTEIMEERKEDYIKIE